MPKSNINTLSKISFLSLTNDTEFVAIVFNLPRFKENELKIQAKGHVTRSNFSCNLQRNNEE